MGLKDLDFTDPNFPKNASTRVSDLIKKDAFALLSELEKYEPEIGCALTLKLVTTGIQEVDDDGILIEFIHLGEKIIQKISQGTEVGEHLPIIQAYYLETGSAYWNRQIYDSAIRTYEKALYFLQSSQAHSDVALPILLRVLKHRISLRHFQVAARDAYWGYSLAKSLDHEGWAEAFAKHLIDVNLRLTKIYTHAAQVLLWDKNEKNARLNIIRALHALAEIISLENNVRGFIDLIREVNAVFQGLRSATAVDTGVINLLNLLINQPEEIQNAELGMTLMEYCEKAYIPVVNTILCINSGGLLVYSKDFVEEDLGEEMSLFSREGKHLYSGIFSALNMSMKGAFGDRENSNSLEYSGKSILIEEGDNFLLYVVSDRETPELRSNLKQLLQAVETEFAMMSSKNSIFSSSAMSQLFEPKIDQFFSQYIPNNSSQAGYH